MHPKPIIVYGIKNCDSVKKARVWLDNKQINYTFHDYRVDGLEESLLKRFVDELGIDAVLNQRSTTWRQLDEEQKNNLTPEKARSLMSEYPTLIKRPIVSVDGKLLVGFKPDQYAAML